MKPKIKIGIDFLMTALLLALMAYQVVGDKLHEWFGAAMLILFVAHNMLNIKWYGALFKGKYKPLRIFVTVLNFAALAAIFMLGWSGIVMSRHVFKFLNITSGMALARRMHLCVSYWGLILMSLHLGAHWGVILAKFPKINKPTPAWTFRVISAAISVYGAIIFVRSNIASYMFLKADFAFFDFEKSAVLVFAEYIAMMILWAFVGYYITKVLRKTTTSANAKGEAK